jgi:hypothetical protein
MMKVVDEILSQNFPTPVMLSKGLFSKLLANKADDLVVTY